MNNMFHDINDDEIRIIGSEAKSLDIGRAKYLKRRRRIRQIVTFCLVFFVLLLIGLIVYLVWPVSNADIDSDNFMTNRVSRLAYDTNKNHDSIPPLQEVPIISHTIFTDTVINDCALTILKPQNATPRLQIGADALKDTTATLVVQAADVRRDNGGIVGACVIDGELVSRGSSKSGFCAIINGKMTVGVADSTPYFEQAIENGGYFFRQYPLVVGGQVVENKLKSASLRKALAELNGDIVVILGHRKMTLNEFADVLADLGVSNAIYLVGSTSHGFAVDEEGNKLEFGRETDNNFANVNYLVWK
ncbi:MAG: phosphodiester glycosidase family protein [Muribaculaceae bacterium]|nr:phosphodiester glycosidase family protein [Muribaculaceae bacterium]